MATDLIPQQPAELVRGAPIDAALLAGYLTASSMRRYADIFGKYTAWCAEHGHEAAHPEALSAWRATMTTDTPYSPNTINQRIDIIKRIMAEAGQRGYITTETAYAFSLIRRVSVRALRDRLKRHSRTRISAADMRRLCEAPPATVIGARDRALLATLASSGLRCTEAASLTVGQIEPRGTHYVVLVQGKTDTEPREAPLSREAYSLILAWLDKRPMLSTAIFTRFDGRGGRASDKAMSGVAVWRTVQTYAQTCGLSHIKPHDFRRFVGTQLAAHDIRKAQKALGHKRIDTTAAHYVLDELEPGLTEDLY